MGNTRNGPQPPTAVLQPQLSTVIVRLLSRVQLFVAHAIFYS